MAQRNTKEIILDVSLKLFSQRGFEATGIREIAEAVGIKPASVYKHFPSKQAIFDAIVDQMNGEYEQHAVTAGLPKGSAEIQAEGYGTLPAEYIADAGMELFRFWTEDERAVQYRRMLTIEQYRSPELAQINYSVFFEVPIKWQAQLFKQMIDAGFFREDDPEQLALEFFAPIMLLIQAFDGAANSNEQEHLANLVHKHIARFGKKHCV